MNFNWSWLNYAQWPHQWLFRARSGPRFWTWEGGRALISAEWFELMTWWLLIRARRTLEMSMLKLSDELMFSKGRMRVRENYRLLHSTVTLLLAWMTYSQQTKCWTRDLFMTSQPRFAKAQQLSLMTIPPSIIRHTQFGCRAAEPRLHGSFGGQIVASHANLPSPGRPENVDVLLDSFAKHSDLEREVDSILVLGNCCSIRTYLE